jgi:hypothetical protein
LVALRLGITAGSRPLRGRLLTVSERDALGGPDESVVEVNVCLVFLELGFHEIN